MKHLSLQEVLICTNGTLIKGSPNITVKRVVTKPANVKENTLLFFFRNKKVNWKVCCFPESSVIVTDKYETIIKYAGKASIVEVANINNAYWDFIKYYRGLFSIPVIGVTGTCGKTTTTEMIKAILTQKFRVHSNYDGNNIFYLSRAYLLGINDRTEAAVFEMGVGCPGHLDYMCKHYRPQVGLLLNIGTYHLEGCKTLENYIKAKAELIEGVDADGTLILNADDQYSKKIDISKYKGKIIYFGVAQNADFKAVNARYSDKGVRFTLSHQNNSYEVYIPGYGKHNVYNALAAIAGTYAVGVDIEESIKGLATFKHFRSHLQLRQGINECTIIDDTWNCTPPSIESAVQVLKDLSGPKSTVAVIGQMPCLGAAGYGEYERLGKIIAKTGIDYLITLGEETRSLGVAAIKEGFDKSNVFYCMSADQIFQALLPLMGPQTLILLKLPYHYRLRKNSSYRDLWKKIF